MIEPGNSSRLVIVPTIEWDKLTYQLIRKKHDITKRDKRSDFENKITYIYYIPFNKFIIIFTYIFIIIYQVTLGYR